MKHEVLGPYQDEPGKRQFFSIVQRINGGHLVVAEVPDYSTRPGKAIADSIAQHLERVTDDEGRLVR